VEFGLRINEIEKVESKITSYLRIQRRVDDRKNEIVKIRSKLRNDKLF
jgi:hypothetical protein